MTFTHLCRIIFAGIVTLYQFGGVVEKYNFWTNPARFLLGTATAVITGLVVFAVLRISVIAETWYQDRLQSRRHHRDG